MNDVLFIAKAGSGKGRTDCVNKSVALMRSMRALASAIINLFPVHCPEARFQGAAHQLVQIHGHLKRRSELMLCGAAREINCLMIKNIWKWLRISLRQTSTVSSSSSHSAASFSSSELLSDPFCAPLPFLAPSDCRLCTHKYRTIISQCWQRNKILISPSQYTFVPAFRFYCCLRSR